VSVDSHIDNVHDDIEEIEPVENNGADSSPLKDLK
jgi:hypothetical protein